MALGEGPAESGTQEPGVDRVGAADRVPGMGYTRQGASVSARMVGIGTAADGCAGLERAHDGGTLVDGADGGVPGCC